MSEIRDIWLEIKVNVYCASVVATLCMTTKLGPFTVSTSSIQTISNALLSCSRCHKAARCYLECCAPKLLSHCQRCSKITGRPLTPDRVLMLDNRLPKADFCGQLKCSEKLRGSVMRWLMGKFKANPQLCVIRFAVWEITSEDFLLWQRIGTYAIITCK